MTTENQTQQKLLQAEPELKWLNQEKRLPCPKWVKWFRDKNGCGLRQAVDAGAALLAAAPQPPALGEPHETLAYLVQDSRDGQFSAHRQDPRGWAQGYKVVELVDRAHVARLQAEVERQRKNFGDMTSLCNEAVQKHDALLARTAELEGLLRKASGFIKISAERLPKKHRTIRSHAFEFVSSIDAALNNKEVPCCTPTDAERAILAAGDHTPQELWGGPRPTCPKCVKTEGQQS